MGLKEKALEEYKIFSEESSAREKKMADDLVARVSINFEKVVGNYPFEVKPENKFKAIIFADGLTIEASENGSDIEYSLLRTCEDCGKKVSLKFKDIKGLGYSLAYRHKCVNDKEVDERKKRRSADKLVQLIKEISHGY